ncbi:MAG TPA: transposase family protein [Methylomirabilota bacterium]|jgi:hypothetical protein|nr:transposase family protein [Methylomirabilota bacterium]
MRDVELYRHLLGLESPGTVRAVELNVREQRVDVWAHHAEGIRWPCPECGVELGLYDHAEERIWRHLDSCQFMPYLHAQPPRVECPTHGIRQVRLPWAEPGRSSISVPNSPDARGAPAKPSRLFDLASKPAGSTSSGTVVALGAAIRA